MLDYNTIVKEMVYGRQHPIEWIEDKITVVHPARGIVPFKLYDFQKNAINLTLAKHFSVCLKSRQVGFSTVTQAFCLWAALHYSQFKILILSTGLRAAVKFLGDIKGMYERMRPEDKWWSIKDDDGGGFFGKKKRVSNNKMEITFENDSGILALPAASSAARGTAVNLLVMDEAAFIPGIAETFMAVYPTLSRAFKSQGNKPYGISIISTPNGISGDGEWYYHQYENAVEKKSRFIPMRVHWSEVPEYDEAWYLDQCETVGWDYRVIQSELELSFLSSGQTFLPNKLLAMVDTVNPVKKSLDGSLWIFKDPEPGHQYVIGVDFAYGTGHDASAIQVLDALTLEQVAEYLSPTVLTAQFAEIIYNLHKQYNNAYTNIERNAGGKILIERILEFHPEMEKRLFKDTKKGDVLHETPKFGKLLQEKDLDIGTQVTGVSRDIILSNMYNIMLEKYLELEPDYNIGEDDAETAKLRFLNSKSADGQKHNVQIKVHGIVSSERLLLQLLGFVTDKKGKPQGDKDDAVLSFAHALYCWTKSRHFLLRDIVDMIPEKVDTKPQLEFEKRYNTQILRNINNGYSQKAIDDYIRELDEADEEIRRSSAEPEDNRAASIWSAFIG